MLIPEADYYIREIALPWHIGGVTVTNDDGTFSVYLNSRLPESTRRHALRHEEAHIAGDHFYRTDITAADMERIAEEAACGS